MIKTVPKQTSARLFNVVISNVKGGEGVERLSICSLRSGSTGNAIVVTDGKTNVLVDCGISGRLAECCLEEIGIMPDEISALVVTHEHIDHIKGVGIFSRKHNVPIYANEETWRAMSGHIGKIEEENIKVIKTGETFIIEDIKAMSFATSHDAAEPIGYVFENDENKVSIATDLGEINDGIFEAISGSSAVLLEANYDLNMLEIGTYPYELKRRIKSKNGHLCNDTAGEFAVELVKSGVKEIVLGHLSRENNHPKLAYQTVKNILEEHGILLDRDVFLHVALRDSVLKERTGFWKIKKNAV